MKERILANLVHLGMNIRTRRDALDPLACEDAEWKAITERMAARGYNMIVIDLNEGVKYESRPEIAVKGAWSVEKLRKELARLRGMGLEPIPKLNFSAMHDEWLGDYGRMVSTAEYYSACSDLIRECTAIFDNPRFFHIGYDEEDVRNQSEHEHVVLRQGELWWHDFLWFVKTVENAGSRTWVWSDWVWEHRQEYLERCPRSVLQSNWYYDQGFNERAFRWPRIKCYLDLDKAGFDQVATASNNVFDSNAAETVEFCEKNLDDSRNKGYMMSSWRRSVAKHRRRNIEAVDLMADAFDKYVRKKI